MGLPKTKCFLGALDGHVHDFELPFSPTVEAWDGCLVNTCSVGSQCRRQDSQGLLHSLDVLLRGGLWRSGRNSQSHQLVSLALRQKPFKHEVVFESRVKSISKSAYWKLVAAVRNNAGKLQDRGACSHFH